MADERPQLRAREAEELIKGMGRVAIVHVHPNGPVTATAVGERNDLARLQNEVDGLLRDIARKYRIVK